MDKRTDINNASLVYGISLLRMLLDMNLITQDEYKNASLSRLRSHLPPSGCKRHSLLAMCSKSNQQDRLCLAQS